jgi:hypothetical protein
MAGHPVTHFNFYAVCRPQNPALAMENVGTIDGTQENENPVWGTTREGEIITVEFAGQRI